MRPSNGTTGKYISADIRRAVSLKSAATSREQKETAIRTIWFLAATSAIIAIFFILLFLLRDSLPVFENTGIIPFLTVTTWYPTGNPPEYGIFVLIVGTVLVTLGAMAFAIPLSIGCAIYISELAPLWAKNILKPAIELLAGIPSVVYGFFGLVVLTDVIRTTFDTPTGETWLAGSILLGIMALPTIISISEDAISMVPREYKEGSLAIGATRWQTISRVIVPGALSGITAAIILGFGRAIGETMAVLMVTGNAAIIPDPIWNVLSPVRTLTGTLGIEMGEVAVGSNHYAALFGIAAVLLAITLIVNSIAVMILTNLRERHMGGAHRKYIALQTLMEWIKRPLTIGGFLLFLIAFFLVVPLYLAVPLLACFGAGYFLKGRLKPKQAEKVAFSFIVTSVIIVLLILIILLQDIVVHGLPALSWEFLTQPPKDLGRAGGIFPAIVGTFYLVTGAILIALPLGVGAAIYLIEYTKEGRVTRFIRIAVDLLNGTPSIVFGLFGLAFLVYFLNFGVSLIAGQVTLALMVLPTMIRATEESLKNIPQSLREGSLALGATRWQTIYRVVLPPAVPGIVTGTILSIGRAAGETAPIMFTAVVFSQRYLTSSVFEPVMALPYHLYILATNVPGSSANKYGTALVLLLLVTGIYSVAIFVRTNFQKKLRG
ncbi:MAG: phosphate ABC transporter permease PstA [Methanoregula sp.]|nr:MAG: phosphate ABC transporter permease PstA [Methanoregula sp.]